MCKDCEEKKDYSKTLNLPKTDFPMRASLPENEPKIQAKVFNQNLYEKMLKKNEGKTPFVLHDGPPYANGEIHIGHALNKVLKDTIIRYKNLQGFYTPYIPGYDTHGMPTEKKAIEKLGLNRDAIPVNKFRDTCKEFTMNYKDKQTEGFKRANITDIGNMQFDLLVVTPADTTIIEMLTSKYSINPLKVISLQDLLLHKTFYNGKIYVGSDVKLSVVIPTYNRKEKLIETLLKLEKEQDQNFNVIVIDNNSLYDIEEIRLSLSKDFNSKLIIHRNSMNLGMNGNLSSIFTYAKDGWIWTLSDDDIVRYNSISIIKDCISRNTTAEALFFSLSDIFSACNSFSEIIINSISELSELYKNLNKDKWNYLYSGDFIFLSNKVFKASLIQECIADIFRYSYTGIQQVYPIIYLLAKKKGSFVISNYKVVDFRAESSSHWNAFEVAIGTSTIMDWNIEASEEDLKTIWKLGMIDYHTIISLYKRKLSQREITIANKLSSGIYNIILDDFEKKEFMNYIEEYK